MTFRDVTVAIILLSLALMLLRNEVNINELRKGLQEQTIQESAAAAYAVLYSECQDKMHDQRQKDIDAGNYTNLNYCDDQNPPPAFYDMTERFLRQIQEEKARKEL